MLILNQVRTVEQRRIGSQFVANCRERLGVLVEFAGALDADPNVPVAVAQQQPAFQAFPHCAFSKQIEALAKRFMRDGGEATKPRGEERSLRRDDTLPPRHALPPLDLGEPGAYLRRCRETLGFTLDEMTERTRIRVLDHIENERFDQLPPEVYLRGYLLEYARELGVAEVAQLAAGYLARMPNAEDRAVETPAQRLRRTPNRE